ncbi:MAG: hypothetical protein DMG05_20235 [Acidobacteria bacterium]|nr:MAG: hypothetical protein DMG05_20235 [Acidobacteriota bacterium]
MTVQIRPVLPSFIAHLRLPLNLQWSNGPNLEIYYYEIRGISRKESHVALLDRGNANRLTTNVKAYQGNQHGDNN